MIEKIRAFFLPKTNSPVKLFAEGLRNENSGDFEKAIINYETALEEVNRSRFPNTGLKTKITEKIKVLNTVKEFGRNFKK